MDPFWGITLSVLAVSKYWRRLDRIKAKEEIAEREIKSKRNKDIIREFTELAAQPMSVAEKKEEKKLKAEEKERMKADKKREKDIADLKKQGYTDELIAVIIPTINNGQ